MTVRIMTGHVMDVLRQIENESVHCVCTSPPYYGLRSYGTEPQVWGGDPNCSHEFETEIVTGEIRTGLGLATLGERYRGGGHKQGCIPKIRAERGFCRCGAWRGDLGLEPTPELFIQHLVEIFREVRRVLRKDGSLWLNLGSSYAGSSMTGGTKSKEGSPGRLNRMFSSGDKHPIPSRQPAHVQPCDSDGIEPSDCADLGFACPGPDDEHLGGSLAKLIGYNQRSVSEVELGVGSRRTLETLIRRALEG